MMTLNFYWFIFR